MKSTFLEFTIQEQSRLWSGTEDHRKKSVVKAAKFANFGQNAGRPLPDYRPAHTHAFFDHLEAQGLSANTINHYGAMGHQGVPSGGTRGPYRGCTSVHLEGCQRQQKASLLYTRPAVSD